ncbi:hypothetical protein M2191_004283 [Bradyrhizobium japonicum]|nr:hypothetical protein [Bradyrhizobium japonicum]
MKRAASSANRSSNVFVCLVRLRRLIMRCAFAVRGRRERIVAFSSPMFATIRAVMTSKLTRVVVGFYICVNSLIYLENYSIVLTTHFTGNTTTPRLAGPLLKMAGAPLPAVHGVSDPQLRFGCVPAPHSALAGRFSGLYMESGDFQGSLGQFGLVVGHPVGERLRHSMEDLREKDASRHRPGAASVTIAQMRAAGSECFYLRASRSSLDGISFT